MLVALLGKRVFADVIKDPEMRRPSWVILVASESSHQCPSKEHRDRRGESAVAVEAETGVGWPQVQEDQQPPGVGGPRAGSPLVESVERE